MTRQECPACGHDDSSGEIEVPDFEYRIDAIVTYVTCAECGTRFQSPMPSLELLASYYPDDYHSQTAGGLLFKIRHDMRLKRIAPLTDEGSVVVDYGCGNGAFLLRAADQLPDRQYIGYEIGERDELVQLAEGKVTLIKGSLDHLFDNLPACQVVTMNHVIEHLPDPADVFRRFMEKLEPGGHFEGQTPAAGSLEHRVFGRYWSGYHAPRHTVVFSADGLHRFLTRLSLHGVKIAGALNPAGVGMSLASAVLRERPKGIQRQGAGWLGWLGVATPLALIDLISGRAGVINYLARKS